jgi:hypothetical protein
MSVIGALSHAIRPLGITATVPGREATAREFHAQLRDALLANPDRFAQLGEAMQTTLQTIFPTMPAQVARRRDGACPIVFDAQRSAGAPGQPGPAKGRSARAPGDQVGATGAHSRGSCSCGRSGQDRGGGPALRQASRQMVRRRGSQAAGHAQMNGAAQLAIVAGLAEEFLDDLRDEVRATIERRMRTRR